MVVLDFVYALLLLITCPFWLYRLCKRRYRNWIAQRLRAPRLPPRPQAIWFHAVSVGEVKSLKSLICQVAKIYPNRVVLSVTTFSGWETAQEELPAIPLFFAPLDFSFTISSFITSIQPAVMVFHELEIWPNWIWRLQRAKIPILLINGRISDRAFPRYLTCARLFRPFLRRIDHVIVQAEFYRERFLQLGIDPERLSLCGNIKADEAYQRTLDIPARQEILEFLGLPLPEKEICTLASSHRADEALFSKAISNINGDFFFIIVPRHPQRSGEISARLRRAAIPFAVHSHGQPYPAGIRVLIFDRLHYLLPIMSISNLVFMGGTCSRRIGGHNLYEPAVLGKPLVGGPHIHNFPDIGRELEQNGIYRKIHSAHELSEFLLNFPNLDLARIRQTSQKIMAAKRESCACTLSHLEKYIRP